MSGPEIRYTTSSGDISIAFGVLGDGPPDIVFVPGFISHADLQWEIGPYTHALTRLAEYGRVAVFDKRGIGLSDRTLGTGTVEDRMDDIRAVMDAAGIERAHLVAVSEGGPLAMVFAATYPERVESLTLWVTFARVRWAEDYPIGAPDEAIETFIGLMIGQWGRGHALDLLAQNLPDDDESRAAIARLERASATPRAARTILQRNFDIDVRHVLPTLSVPTLMINRTDDPRVPVEIARYTAERIRGVRYLELPGDWHVNADPDGDADAFDAIIEFITGERPRQPVDRVLATVLFTDICDSTRRAAEIGDRQWTDLLARHDALTASAVEEQRGQFVKTTGDGALATFDGPARAVRCADSIHRRIASIDLEVRAGLHTGEIERQNHDVAGIAVHIGARVAALADAGEVLVSQTVKDLVLGSELAFEPRGPHQLKGVPGEWQLYAMVR